MASKIACLMGIPCATVDIGVYNNKVGSMSYMMLDTNSEILTHGIEYIANKYPFYSSEQFKDIVTQKNYSIQIILECIEHLNLKKDFLSIPIFDCLIGNSDRHHNNWGTITNIATSRVKIAPLYDNGSALGCYVRQQDVEGYFKDDLRFNALIYSKSRSRIGWKDIKKPRHFELLGYIYQEFYSDTIEIVASIKTNLGDEVIDNLIQEYDESIMKSNVKQLISRFLKTRRKSILDQYRE